MAQTNPGCPARIIEELVAMLHSKAKYPNRWLELLSVGWVVERAKTLMHLLDLLFRSICEGRLLPRGPKRLLLTGMACITAQLESPNLT
jgi:hypothetical protein